MIEIKYEQANKLYNEIRNIVLAEKDKSRNRYEKKQHNLYEQDASKELRASYYNESGSIEIQNVSGETIIIGINRWHAHKHNGMSGLNGTPCLSAIIYIKEGDDKKKIWELKVDSGTMYYKAETTSVDIPKKTLLQAIDVPPIEPEEQHDKHSKDNQDEVHESTNNIIEPPEKRELFEVLKELRKNYLIIEQNGKTILSKREHEIQKATEAIMTSYSEKINQNNNAMVSSKIELNDFDKLISKYFSFDSILIGEILQQLVSVIEGEEYSYQVAIHNTKKREHGVMDSWDEDIQNQVKLIIQGNKKNADYYSDDEYHSVIARLVKDGKAILLSEQSKYSQQDKDITFYSANDGKVNSHVDFGKFDYIKEFIDGIIQYRFQHNIEQIAEKDLLLFMSSFVSNNKDLIASNYHSRVEEKILKIQLGKV